MTTKTERQSYINDLLQRLTNLVCARELLEQGDKEGAELRQTDAEIDDLHWRLARIVRANEHLERAA